METKEDKSMTRHAAEARGSEPGDLYQRDYYTWALEQARALRTRRGEALDWENLAEEVEGLALSEERELESRLEVLLVHLLKWRYQTKKRSRSWQLTIREQRHGVGRVLSQNPGLKRTLSENVVAAYEIARIVAARQTRLSERTFAPTCPWGLEQIPEDGFWPK